MANGKTGGTWSDPVLLHNLIVCFYEAGMEAGAMTSEFRKDIEARIKAKGHQVTWEGIRQHIQKLRRDQGSPEKAAVKNGDTIEPATPVKTKARKRKSPAKTTLAKSTTDVNESDEEGDEIAMKLEAVEARTPSRGKKLKVETNEPFQN